MSEWAIRLEQPQADCAARLRGRDGVRICTTETAVWVRAPVPAEPDPLVASLPGTHFSVGEDGQLSSRGHLVPTGTLPDAVWSPVDQWVEVTFPTVRWASADLPAVPLELVRTSDLLESDGLLLSPESWLHFGETAPQIRLERLRFAASADMRIFVTGTPLPPLEGRQFVVRDRIAVPAGFRWSPAVSGSVVRRAFSDADGIILWESTDIWQVIPGDAFVQATRTAIRATLQAGGGLRE